MIARKNEPITARTCGRLAGSLGILLPRSYPLRVGIPRSRTPPTATGLLRTAIPSWEWSAIIRKWSGQAVCALGVASADCLRAVLWLCASTALVGITGTDMTLRCLAFALLLLIDSELEFDCFCGVVCGRMSSAHGSHYFCCVDFREESCKNFSIK